MDPGACLASPPRSTTMTTTKHFQPTMKCDDKHGHDLLSELPPELRLHIFDTLDLDGLSSLVHASPVFHSDYRSHRRSVLLNCLQLTLHPIAVDAYAVYQSSSDEFANSRTRDRVTNFISSYQSRRASANIRHLPQLLTEEDAVNIAAFHSSVIKPLARFYADWALTNLSVKPGASTCRDPLSKAEEARLFRSLYRFQLCCNLFGAGRLRDSQSFRASLNKFEPVEILELFLCLYEPWEVEEIACIYTFAEEKYDKIFGEISRDIKEENPRFNSQRSPTTNGAINLDNSFTKESLLKGTISRGLDLLHMILYTISDHEQLVSTMQVQITWPVGYFLEHEAWGETAQWRLRDREPLLPREQKQQCYEPLLFTGDGDSETNGPRPPLAWTTIWGGTYSNLFGYYIDRSIRLWGYVMWDATRLQQTGAKEVLLWQWERDWGDDDPRCEVF